MPCALCPVGGDVAKRQEYSNWRKLGFMDENNECSKDHRGDGSLWFWGRSQPIGLGPRRWWGNGLEGDGGEIFGATTVRKPHTIIQHKIRGVS